MKKLIRFIIGVLLCQIPTFAQSASETPYMSLDRVKCYYPNEEYLTSIVSKNCKYQFVHDNNFAILDFESRDTIIKYAPGSDDYLHLQVEAIDESNNLVYYSDKCEKGFCLIRRSILDINKIDTFYIGEMNQKKPMKLSNDFNYLYWLDSPLVVKQLNLNNRVVNRYHKFNKNLDAYSFSVCEDQKKVAFIDSSAVSIIDLSDNSNYNILGTFSYVYIIPNKELAILYEAIPKYKGYYNVRIRNYKTGSDVKNIDTIFSSPIKVIALDFEKYMLANAAPGGIVFDTKTLDTLKYNISFGYYQEFVNYKNRPGIFSAIIYKISCVFNDLAEQRITKVFGADYVFNKFINDDVYFVNYDVLEKYNLNSKKNTDAFYQYNVLNINDQNKICFINNDYIAFGEIKNNQIVDIANVSTGSLKFLSANIENRSAIYSNISRYMADTIYIDRIGDDFGKVWFSWDKIHKLNNFKISKSLNFAIDENEEGVIEFYDVKNNLKRSLMLTDKSWTDSGLRKFQFSKDEESVYFVGSDGIYEYIVNSNETHLLYPCEIDHFNSFNSFVVSDDNRFLVLGYNSTVDTPDSLKNTKLIIVDLQKKSIIRSFYVKYAYPAIIGISPDNNYLVCSYDLIYRSKISESDVEIQKFDKTKIMVYPNPSSSFVAVRSSNGMIINWYISDEKGAKLLKDDNCRLNSFDIDISNLHDGGYFLTVFDGFKTETIKFLKN
jgi:hypothetical protein